MGDMGSRLTVLIGIIFLLGSAYLLVQYLFWLPVSGLQLPVSTR